MDKNKRQIPKVEKICSDKRYLDILYSYLQEISDWDGIQGHSRTIPKKIINFSRLGQKFDLTRQTVAKKFKNLIDMGLVRESDNEEIYILIILEQNVSSLIPYDTVKILNDAMSVNAISTYVYLFNRYYANNCEKFYFTLTQIKNFIGLGVETRHNNDTVKNILLVLSNNGLIQYYEEVVVDEDTKMPRTQYCLDKLNLTVKRTAYSADGLSKC